MKTLHSAMVLHSRAYRDTSLITELFVDSLGRVPVVVRGIRSGRSAWRGVLQAFSPLLVSFSGRGELKTLTQAEPQGAPYFLKGRTLVTGLYLNELLLRVLPAYDAHPHLFQAYQNTIRYLSQDQAIDKTLRDFEWKLLNELGYGLAFSMIKSDRFYFFDPEQGFQESVLREHQQIFSGDILLEIANLAWNSQRVLTAAKRLFRLALSPMLGSRPLRTRELLQ